MLIEGAKPIWPNDVEIPVLGVTGGYGSGKTLLLLTLAPGKHAEGHKFAGQPRTRYYDFELSGATYTGLGQQRIKVQEEMLKTHPKGYKPIDVFKWWLKDIATIQPGQYDVVAADTAGDLESGLADYIKSQYAEYGFGSAEKFESMGGVFWKYVKEFLKMKLSDLATRCQCFAFSAHLQKVWANGKATSREKPAGKSTLMELSTLYMWLDRSADGTGKVPATPRCRELLKNRLVFNTFDEATGEVTLKPYLPPAFPVATVQAIREFILKPVDYKKLKPDHLVQHDVMTEEERLQAEQETAQLKLETEQTALARLNRMAEIQGLAAKAKAGQQTEQEVAPSPVNNPPQADTPAAEAAPEPSNSISEELVNEIKQLQNELSMPDAALTSGLQRAFKKTNLTDLTPAEGERLAKNFKALVEKKRAATTQNTPSQAA